MVRFALFCYKRKNNSVFSTSSSTQQLTVSLVEYYSNKKESSIESYTINLSISKDQPITHKIKNKKNNTLNLGWIAFDVLFINLFDQIINK